MTPLNSIIHGDCTEIMPALASASVDMILTDPPYMVHYEGRDGRTVQNDDNARWLKPAFAEMHRVLKDGGFCISFYAWNKVDLFMAAWKQAGFRPVGHIVFRKKYASSSGFLQYRHESAYLLGKGELVKPRRPLPDLFDWEYTGNRLHPTQKPVGSLRPLIRSFCPEGGVVLDPFCGSGSTCVAVADTGRAYIGMELDEAHHRTATDRLARMWYRQNGAEILRAA